ncbi:MAG: hypothetical protein ACI8Q1_000225 [Parvicella sp.]|jgi:hypothetical protein
MKKYLLAFFAFQNKLFWDEDIDELEDRTTIWLSSDAGKERTEEILKIQNEHYFSLLKHAMPSFYTDKALHHIVDTYIANH